MSAAIWEVPPGSIVLLEPRQLGLTAGMWYRMPPGRAPVHAIAWDNGELSFTNLGLAPSKEPNVREYNSFHVIIEAK